MAHIGKLVVCGVGLIGGSFALALRRAGAVERIVGIGRRREVLERACALGVIDEIAEGWADALDGADLVLLAAPVGQTDAILAAMAPHLRPGTVVTDAGIQLICPAADACLCSPMAHCCVWRRTIRCSSLGLTGP